MQIFRRLSRGVVPTAAGRLVLSRARTVLLELTQLSDELGAKQADIDEELVLGAPPFIAWTWLPRLLAVMQQEGKLPHIRVVEGRLGEMVKQFDAGDVDALVTMESPSELSGLRPDGLRIEAVGREQWTVVCSPDFAAAHGLDVDEPVTWVRLRELPWILPPRPTNARMAVEAQLYQLNLSPIIPKFESLNAITNISFAEHGLGLTLLAGGVVSDRVATGRLAELAVCDLPPSVSIVLVHRQSQAQLRSMAILRSAAQRLTKE